MATHQEKKNFIEGTRQKANNLVSEDNIGGTIRKAVDLLQMQMKKMVTLEPLNIILPLKKESLDIPVDSRRVSKLCSLGYLLSESLETTVKFISKNEGIRQRIAGIKQETQNRNAIDNGEFNDLCTLSEVLDGIEAVKNEQRSPVGATRNDDQESSFSDSDCESEDEDARCPFKCDLCGKKFAQKVAVIAHKKRIHLRDDDPLKHRFKCDGCDKKFFDISQFEQHKRIHYENEEEKKPFKCEKCDFRTTYKTSIKLHMRVHLATDDLSLEKFQCDICDKYYNSRGGLLKHKKLHLVNVELSRPHRCDECGKRFSQKGSLRKHINIHHSSDPRKEFECEVCGKLYKTRQTLSSHKVVHLHENDPLSEKHKCDICKKIFFNSDTLNRHKIVHLRGTLRCDKCDETFTCKRRFNVHVRRHNRPFECGDCGRKFIHSGNFKVHIARKHGAGSHGIKSRSTTSTNDDDDTGDEEMEKIPESDEDLDSSDDINSDEEEN